MGQNGIKSTAALALCHTAATDGDWAEVAPEMVRNLTSYLNTDQFAVMTGEEHPEAVVCAVMDAFCPQITCTQEDGYITEMGYYEDIPAVLVSTDLSAVYFRREDESKVLEIIERKVPVPIDFVSLPDSPPIEAASSRDLFELRVWVPSTDLEASLWRLKRAFSGHRPVYIGPRESVWVPTDTEKELLTGLETLPGHSVESEPTQPAKTGEVLAAHRQDVFWQDLKSGKFASMVRDSAAGEQLHRSAEVYNVMKPLFAEQDDVEVVYGIFLNAKNRILTIEKLASGSIMGSALYPREIVKRVIELKSTAIVLAHNHPSGDTTPSLEDMDITTQIIMALKSIGVSVHDHVIVGDGYHSMADSGYLETMRNKISGLSAP